MSAVLQSTSVHNDVIPVLRPQLFLVPPATPDRLPHSVYRRRRYAAAGITALAVLALWVVAQTIAAALVNEVPTTPMQPISATQPVAAAAESVDYTSQYYTVRPGDTLWSIAQAVHPKGDFRPVLKRLDDRYGSTGFTPGQNILVS